MKGHESARAGSTTWLTPPPILEALGGWQSFDLDPCAAPDPRPWPTARHMNARADANGLMIEWFGRVLLNPPYSTAEVRAWMARMADHDHGTALIFARTDTDAFQRFVLGAASGLLFIKGRLTFFDQHGREATRRSGRGSHAGAPSVLCAYGQEDLDRLAAADLEGRFVPLRIARFALIEGMDQTWRQAIAGWLLRQEGPVSLGDAYRYFARHPKARRNPNWQAKIRQQLQQLGRRVERGRYERQAA